MSLFDAFRRHAPASHDTASHDTASHAPHSQFADRRDILSHYKQVRQVSMRLNSRLMATLSREVLHEGGRKLGMLQGNTLFFNTEDESSVLADYCIYDVRRNGCNAVEQFLISIPPESDSEELDRLRSMQQAFYSLFVVETAEPGLGVTVQDLRTQETMLVVDMGLGNSARPGLFLASRLLPCDDFTMTSGAALPLGIVPAGQRDSVARRLLATLTIDADGHFDPAPLIRTCLRAGSSSHVQYQDLGGEHQPVPSGRRSRKIGRNETCPCGSGRKYKHCCLNRF